MVALSITKRILIEGSISTVVMKGSLLAFSSIGCMVISRKRAPTTPASPILLNGIPLERVELFKHLGVVSSLDLSWSNHTISICAKVKRILGLLYRRYYNHVEGDVLKQLYISLVRLHLEYGYAVWAPYTLKDKRNLEQVQKFACKMVSKHWDSEYEDLLELVGLPPLENRRIYLKSCLLYKITHGLCHFPTGIFTPRQISHNFRMNSFQLCQLFARN